jgi:hypothetical protein
MSYSDWTEFSLTLTSIDDANRAMAELVEASDVFGGKTGMSMWFPDFVRSFFMDNRLSLSHLRKSSDKCF